MRTNAGFGSGLLGVVIFSGSLPATRIAVGGFAPLFLTGARAVIAGLLGGALLWLLREKRPAPRDLAALSVVALGVVVGWPLLTALAMQRMSAAQGCVFVGILPLATALFAVLRGGERPRPVFWVFSLLGAGAVAGFALTQGGAAGWAPSLMMLAGILLCGLGYAEGAALSRRLGGWQVISWALLLSLPVTAALAVATRPEHWTGIGPGAWTGLAYVSVLSMLVGFLFWYRGLALGGIARVGQLQLLQPFLGLAFAALVIGEPVSGTMLAVSALVVLCVAGAKRFA
jgi:drug/metabolite transporter (DMT)-like permease